MANASSFVSKQDDLEISTYTWATSADPARGVVQIAHGLAEHGSRYARFAAALNDAGFHVVASDHRGHGQSIVDTPGDFGAAAFAGLWADTSNWANHCSPSTPTCLCSCSLIPWDPLPPSMF